MLPVHAWFSFSYLSFIVDLRSRGLLRLLRLCEYHGFLGGICERSVTALRAVRPGVNACRACYGGSEGDADVVDGVASLCALRRREERAVEEVRQKDVRISAAES